MYPDRNGATPCRSFHPLCNWIRLEAESVNRRLHGRINVVFFILTLTALVGLEVVVRLIKPDIFHYFTDEMRVALWVHLAFSIPAALLLPAMLWTGKTYRTTLHYYLGLLFLVLWAGTFVTGIFFLPHQ